MSGHTCSGNILIGGTLSGSRYCCQLPADHDGPHAEPIGPTASVVWHNEPGFRLPEVLPPAPVASDLVPDLMAALEKSLAGAKAVLAARALFGATPDPNGRCLSCGVHTGEAVEFCPDCLATNEDDDL